MTDDNRTSLTVFPEGDDATKVGNYFVSNYPPFSVWSPQHVSDAIDRLDRPGDEQTPIGMYVHIPYCRKRCHFCYFRVYTDQNSDDIRRYIDAVIEEAAMLAQRSFIAGRRLRYVYFGGGTPSYLSAAQLEYLFDGLQRALPWDAVEEVTFECEPGTLNANKLLAIQRLGVTRLSLGIENFDDTLLEMNNRAHRSKQVYDAYEWARSADFAQINIDLIAGMLGETPQNWQRCVDKAIKMRADAVTIYQMEVPYNTTIYQQMRRDGGDVAPVADWPTKRRWVERAYEALEAAQYTIGSAYTAVLDPQRIRFVYRDALWQGADMLGVGVSSFGHLAGVHYQNQADIVPYISTVRNGELPIYRAMVMTDEQQMIRQFVLQLKIGRLAKNPFLERFGVDVFDRWSDVLGKYRDQGLLTFDDETLTLTRRGLLRVDGLLQAFFLPEHREVRYT